VSSTVSSGGRSVGWCIWLFVPVGLCSAAWVLLCCVEWVLCLFLCFVLLVFSSVGILDKSRTESSWIKTKKTGTVLTLNIQARSHNRCCHWKAINITYSKCVSVALAIHMQCACPELYWHLWPVWCTIFSHGSSQTAQFSERRWTYVCFDFLYKFYLKNLSF